LQRHLPEHHVRSIDKITVQGDVFPGCLVTSRPDLDPRLVQRLARPSFLQENDVGGNVRQCVLFEGIVWQADRAHQVCTVSYKFPGGRVICVQEEIADDDGNHPAVTYLVQRFRNKEIMNREVAELVVTGVVQPLIAEWRIADRNVEIAARDGDLLKALIDDRCGRIKMFRNRSRHLVEFHAGDLCLIA